MNADTQTFLFDSDFCVSLESEQLEGHIVISTSRTDSPVICMVFCVLA